MAATACAAAAAIAGLPAPMFPSVYDRPELAPELNILAAGEFEAEFGLLGFPKDSLATSLAKLDSTSVVGRLSEWLVTEPWEWRSRLSEEIMRET